MSAHRVVLSCKLDGMERTPGQIVFYEGPMRAELEPLNAAEQSAWVRAGHWRLARSFANKLRGPDPRLGSTDEHR